MVVETIGPPAMTVLVRTMEPEDLPFAAELHERVLRNGLFPALGRRFLVHYLNTYVRSSAGVALVAEWAGTPAGFLVGVLDEPTHYRHVVRRHGARLAASGLMGLIRRPGVAWWFWRTRARRYAVGLRRLASGGLGERGASTDERPEAILSHVAVLPQLHGNGIGLDLVGSFLAAARAMSVATARLTTEAGTDGAGDFYLRLGWYRADRYVDADGISWERFRFDLT